MESTERTVEELAREAVEYFEEAWDGEAFTRLKDGAPVWVEHLVRAGHGDMLPDDWRYSCIAAALAYIAGCGREGDADDFAVSQVDIHATDRLAWLASHPERAGYVDEAVGIMGRIALGQYAEAFKVYDLVASELSWLVKAS